MSEINPPTRPLMVHEIYPAVKTRETREIYAKEGKGEEEAQKVDEAYAARAVETSNTRTTEEEEQIVTYDMENGEVTTSTTSSSSSSTEHWIA